MPTEEARHAEIEKLTKGEAANIITRMKHGAQASVPCFEGKHHIDGRII